MQQVEQRIKTRRTVNGFIIECDPASWASLMSALSMAIDHSDQERAATFRKVRTALSQASQD